jgi:proline iminopeptidase
MIPHPPGRSIQVGGRRLWVETEGAGPPVLLLPGPDPAADHTAFHLSFGTLAADYEVHYLDLYGRGSADRPDDPRQISFAGDVLDVATLIADLDVGPVHVYGLGYGAQLGYAVAAEYPGLLRSLMLAGTHLGAHPVSGWPAPIRCPVRTLDPAEDQLAQVRTFLAASRS